MYKEPTISNPTKKEFPDYEETFGHIAEKIIRDSIGKKAGLFIENVEQGTKPEDYRMKVDFWIKFIGVDAPLGIQYTVSDNEDKIQEKKDFLRSRNFSAKKEKRPDAEINWSGNANVVLVRGNKLKMAKIDKKSREDKVNPAELVGDEFIRGFFSQIMVELKEISPLKMQIIAEAIQSAYDKDMERQKSKNKRLKV